MLKKVTIIKHIGDCRNKIMHFNEELSSTYHDLEIKTLLLQKSSLLVCSFAVSAQKKSFCFAMHIEAKESQKVHNYLGLKKMIF